MVTATEVALQCGECGTYGSFPWVMDTNIRCLVCREIRWALRPCPSCGQEVACEFIASRLHCPKCDNQWVEVMRGPQSNFVLSQDKYPGLFSGRGGGKTSGAVLKSFDYVGKHPGARGILTEPTYGLVDTILIPTIRELFGHLEGTLWELKVGKYEIRFPTLDAVIFLRPGEEPDKCGTGTTLAFGGMDEIKVGHQHETFMQLIPSLRQKGYPHQLWVTSTPHWQKPWIRQRWKERINPRDGSPLPPTYKIFQANTADNWHLPDQYVEGLRADFGDTRHADQEIGGEFVIVEGAGFPQFDSGIHVRVLPLDIEFDREVAGLDFGATSPTSLHLLGLDRSKKVWVTKEFYKRDADDYDWVRTVRDWGVKKVVCDPSISDRSLKELRRNYGVPLRRAPHKEFSVRSRMFGARLTVREDGHPGMYISPDCPNLIAEIPNLAFDQPRGQEYAVDAWMQGTQDHAYDSTCYGLQGIDRMLPKGTKPPELRVMI